MLTHRTADILLIAADPEILTWPEGSPPYRIQRVSGTRQAVEQLGRERFDLVLLSLQRDARVAHGLARFMAARTLDTKLILMTGESGGPIVRGVYASVRRADGAAALCRTIDNALQSVWLERENRAMSARLEHSEKLYRYLVSTSPDIVYMLDAEGRFTFFNSRIEVVLGYARRELIGRHYSALVHPGDLGLARQLFEPARVPEHAPQTGQVRLLARTGCGFRYFELHSVRTAVHGAPGRPGAAEQRLVSVYGIARDVTERKRAHEFIHYQAYHDLLSGLPNRRLFTDRLGLALTKAKRHGHGVAVLVLDLDRFKLVNETLGHISGDELLEAVSTRLRALLGGSDTLARVGGDEFMVLLPRIAGRPEAGAMAERILGELQQSFTVSDREVFASVSIGIALYPDHGVSRDALMQNADIAMCHAKRLGKGGYQFYDDTMNAVFLHHLSLETDMRKGLERNEFKVLYQPRVNGRTGEIMGVEALVRWQHPTRGLLMPADFVPLAEDNRLIVPLGEWLVRTVCAEARSWRDLGLPAVRIAINMSMLEVEQPQIAETLTGCLQHNRLPGAALEIELTENVIMKDPDSVSRKLRQLSTHGIRVAIDDFGTGYSSLSYLQKLPLHTLKIDRSFVADLKTGQQSSSIIPAIIAMAHRLGLLVVAEGVETEAQRTYLLAHGCIEMQGFLFSAPLEAAVLRRLLSRARAAAV